MATVYSLVCWGGKDGKAVTVSASTDLVTLTYHGLRDGKGVQFTSGTLPTVSGTALAINMTYYAKWISITTFELYYDQVLTAKIDFTSTGASLVMKGAYYQGLADTSRWGTRIYDGRVAWNTARAAASTVFDTDVAELGDDFDDIVAASFSVTTPSAAVVMTSLVNGVRSPAWHGGVVGAGYVAQVPNGGYTAIGGGIKQDLTLDGFSASALSTTVSGTCVSTSGRGGNMLKNMIMFGAGVYGWGITIQGAMTKVKNCLITMMHTGVNFSQYTYGAVFANNTVAGNAVNGITYTAAGSTYGKLFNNVVFGNGTTNWQTGSLTALETASNNTYETGNPAWVVGSGTSIAITAVDFADYAGGDFRPSAASLLVDAGTDYYGRLGFDLADAEVPNYNNGGPEGVDIGCLEFDHGYGPHPTLTDFTFAVKDDSGGNVINFEYRLYLKDPAAGIIGSTELDGAENYASSSRTWQHGYSSNTDVVLQIIKDGYEEALVEYTLNTTPLTTTVYLVTERNI